MYAFVMKNIRTITFAVNTTKPGAAESARFLAGIAECEGAETQILENYRTLDALQGQDLCVAVAALTLLVYLMRRWRQMRRCWG